MSELSGGNLCDACERALAALKARETSAIGGHQPRAICVGCARQECSSDRELAKRFRPLLRPIKDNVVILREVVPDRIGRIFIPATSFDERGKLRTDQASYGIVLAMGPGNLHRVRMGERIFKDRLDPMPPISVGQRVLFQDKYEIGTSQWRGLSIVHGFDILGDATQEAAAE